ncbi:hypothetical protein [Pantoea ananatis]|jgi:DNA polymerase IIIc chi subunit|uniref:hypothetical protein n=1 Tax=Pantoea ananas TaxID=553 RepID=UPI00188F7B23|nr:hypothetical protein [Pantoea ananatis]MDC7868837.1 hypothetical protein [Pantoea ananatis]
MRRFVSGGLTFYLLDPGDTEPNLAKEYLYIPRYLIKPVDNGWRALILHTNERDWQQICDRLFVSENEAFNFAYEHFSVEQSKTERLLPGWKSV